MDPPPEGFEELERAFREAEFAFAPINDNNNAGGYSTWRNRAPPASRRIPTTYADIPDSDDEEDEEAGVAPHLSRRGATPRAITPPQQLNRQSSGLPPTPPTMANSDATDAPLPRINDPSPLFADHVRNALQSQASGLAVPPADNRSPPTPDSTPEASGDNLDVPRPHLTRYPSSRAESFRTAVEHHDDAEDRESVDIRPKTYVPESDGEVERNTSYLASDEKSTTDSAPPSPQFRKVSGQQPPHQRLRTIIQPGDSLKRPDEALIYSSTTWRTSTILPKPPRRAKTPALPQAVTPKPLFPDSKVVSDAAVSQQVQMLPSQGLARNETNKSWETATPADGSSSPEDSAPLPPPLSLRTRRIRSRSSEVRASLGSSRSKDTIKPEPTAPSPQAATTIDDFPLPEAPAPPPPPPSDIRSRPFRPLSIASQSASLEDNNAVYKLIQQENVRRHSTVSILSERSLQALGIGMPERSPSLKHHAKRESLRVQPTNATAKHTRRPSGDETINAHRLRHKPGQVHLLDSSEAYRVPDEAPLRTPTTGPIGLPKRGDRASEFAEAPPRRAVTFNSPLRSTREKVSSQHTRTFSDGSSRLVQSPAFNHLRSENHARPSTSSGTPQPTSLHQQQQQRTSSALGHRMGTPESPRTLRSFARDRRLENNMQVRRTSALRSVDCAPENELQVSLGKDLRTSSEVEPTKPIREKLGEERRTSLGRKHAGQATGEIGGIKRAIDLGIRMPNRVLTDPDETQQNSSIDQYQDGKFSRRPISTERRISLDKASVLSSPRRKSLDVRNLHPPGTPFSSSQLSDRTGTEVEFLEAKGVEIFPHNNKSLLVVNQPGSGSKRENAQQNEADVKASIGQPVFQAVIKEPDTPIADHHRPSQIQPPTENDGQAGALHSPLTNPRPAPAPPLINYIPPTPNTELERELSGSTLQQQQQQQQQQPPSQPPTKAPTVHRSLSLSQRVRRASATLITHPFRRSGGSLHLFRKPDPPQRCMTAPPPRDTHLSPRWQPQRGDDSDDSSDDEFYDDDDERDDADRVLPPGGDTSSLGHSEPANAPSVLSSVDPRAPFLPRRMSVRVARALSLRSPHDRGRERGVTPSRARSVSQQPIWPRRRQEEEVTTQPFRAPWVGAFKRGGEKAERKSEGNRKKAGLWDEPEVDTVVPAL